MFADMRWRPPANMPNTNNKITRTHTHTHAMRKNNALSPRPLCPRRICPNALSDRNKVQQHPALLRNNIEPGDALLSKTPARPDEACV